MIRINDARCQMENGIMVIVGWVIDSVVGWSGCNQGGGVG